MQKLTQFFIFMCCLALSSHSAAFSINQLSQDQATNSLKQLLEQGSDIAIKQLGQNGGFSQSPKWRIELPNALQKPAKLMRTFGQGKYVNELEDSLNTAAEQAIPHAKELLLNAISKIRLEDAKQILSAHPTAATDFLKRTSEAELRARFLPIVQQQTNQSVLSQQYSQVASKAKKFGFSSDKVTSIEDYVTEQAITALFAVLAEQESALRANPKQAAGSLLKQVLEGLR
ncbi:MAG: DUF4197 domain-containing protein [Gammaproteobacteria bacterium]|nr:DUF4197 domain-containing protein [Gammaproteobacteria bacterium]